MAFPRTIPFVGVAGYRGEIFAMGFRNPYKIAFDPGWVRAPVRR